MIGKEKALMEKSRLISNDITKQKRSLENGKMGILILSVIYEFPMIAKEIVNGQIIFTMTMNY